MLHSINAPEFIIRGEENKLAYTIVVHFRGEQVTD